MNERAAWKKLSIKSALWLLLFTAWVAMVRAPQMALFLVQSQDIPVLALLSASILLVSFWLPNWSLPTRLPPDWALVLAGLALASLLAWGTYGLMGNFPVSRDEHMVLFDMAVFKDRRLAVPIAPEWRAYALALVPNFLLNDVQPSGLVSDYLPMNAILRLGFSKLADPGWFNPLLVLIGGAALLDIARRTFGPNDKACSVVLLVYALSAQILVTAMSTYSMSAHLAFNLIWLAAFLRGGKVGHSFAIATGFVATGLHQLVFHPFFVAPFLIWRFAQGERRLALGYVAAYLLIISWWMAYPFIISPLVAGPAGEVTGANIISDKLVPLLRFRDSRTIGLMTLNLLRFISWQNFVLLPLLVAATAAVRREGGFARALALGIVGWLIFVAVILPEQGRGYGYRYLHGYLGSFAMLAGFGYRELESRIGRQADGLVLVMSGLTLILAIPLLLVNSYRFLQPRLAVERLIAGQTAPFVLVDDTKSVSLDGRWTDGAQDFVRNQPDLTNRPLRFSAQYLTPSLLEGLCRRGRVTLVTKDDMIREGFLVNAAHRSPQFEALVTAGARETPDCFQSAVNPAPKARGTSG